MRGAPIKAVASAKVRASGRFEEHREHERLAEAGVAARVAGEAREARGVAEEEGLVQRLRRLAEDRLALGEQRDRALAVAGRDARGRVGERLARREALDRTRHRGFDRRAA